MKETKKRKQKPKRMGRETKTRKEHHAEWDAKNTSQVLLQRDTQTPSSSGIEPMTSPCGASCSNFIEVSDISF
jgi:hypothetical protein